MSAMRIDLKGGSKKPMSKLPPEEYASVHGFEGGTNVIVFVGETKKQFTLPKDFLCQHSEYFRAAFEGNWQEAESLTSNLESVEVEAFRHVLQWIGTGAFVLPELDQSLTEMQILSDATAEAIRVQRRKENKTEFFNAQILQCIDFLVAADFLILLPSPVPAILQRLTDLVKEVKVIDPITPHMIVKVWQLPSDHPAREFFAKACVEDYLQKKFHPDNFHGGFACAAELESVPGFATQFVDAVVEVMAKPISLHNPSKELSNITVKNPIDGMKIIIKGEE